MKKHFYYFVFALLGMLVLSCNPNDDNSGSNNSSSDFAENFGNAVSRDFIGQVVNENNQPLQGVAVKIGTTTVQTDINGVFIINNANVYEQFAYITAKKAGYIDGSRAIVPTNGKNNVKIMMISNTPVQTIQSGVASEVILPNGTKVNFDGAFQDENGTAYSGSVQVAMFHLEASNENLSNLMPGMLYAEDANGEEKVLETYGMMNVELKGSGGQKLQIASGHTAQITMAIDDTQLATAPNSIPLWHFDEVNGYWKEEGSAQRVGNNYVGTVSHFSWWNCDAPFPTVSLTVNVADSNGNVIPNVLVQIVRSVNNYSYGSTDNNGQISGLVPSNELLTVNVYTSFGGCNIYTASIGPFSSDTVLPTIVINASGSAFVTHIVGNLKKCDNSNVTNGYVVMNRSGYSPLIYMVNNGAFSFSTIYCDDTEFSLKGFDFDSMQETDSINYNFTSQVTNVGNLMTCNAVTEFISYQKDNEPTVFLLENPSASLMSNGAGTPLQLQISSSGNGQQNILFIYQTGLNGSEVGNYTTNEYNIEGTVGYIHSGNPNTIIFSLNSIGNVGEYVDMTFSGTYSDATGNHTINGVAHVIRDN